MVEMPAGSSRAQKFGGEAEASPPLLAVQFQNSYQGTGGTGGSVPSIPQLGLVTDEACETGTASNAIAARNNQAIFFFIKSP